MYIRTPLVNPKARLVYQSLREDQATHCFEHTWRRKVRVFLALQPLARGPQDFRVECGPMYWISRVDRFRLRGRTQIMLLRR